MRLYIHIPFCMRKCLYCDFLSFAADGALQKTYMAALRGEIRHFGEQYGKCKVETVYIGGGTPSLADEKELAAVLDTVYRVFDVEQDAEISMECNPGTVTREKLRVYRQSGMNRLSIGLQSAKDEELKRLGRVHDFAAFLRTWEFARESGFTNLNVDVMSGLPGQSPADFVYTLKQVIRLRPEHISAYSLIVEPETPFWEQYVDDVKRQEAGLPTKHLPTEDEICEMLKQTEERLQKAGYEHYEISNYAKKGFACRHNIGYWKRADYLGVGLGAASLINDTRYTNTTDLRRYLKFPPDALRDGVEPLSKKDRMEEFMFLGLRMYEGVSRADFERNFGCPIETVYGDVLNQLAEDGLLVRHAGRIFLTERGQEVSNVVLAKFLW